MSQAANSLMAIFGYKRISCETCSSSEGRDDQSILWCNRKQFEVRRDAACADYVREPGSDDE